jgi:hypothetical protein
MKKGVRLFLREKEKIELPNGNIYFYEYKYIFIKRVSTIILV